MNLDVLLQKTDLSLCCTKGSGHSRMTEGEPASDTLSLRFVEDFPAPE